MISIQVESITKFYASNSFGEHVVFDDGEFLSTLEEDLEPVKAPSLLSFDQALKEAVFILGV